MLPKITVVTTTLNAATHLPRLIASLQTQTDKAFCWVVADALSKDQTIALVEASGLDQKTLQREDFGIYDALNGAVEEILDGYYLVVGADDRLFPDTIAAYRAAAIVSECPDFVAAGILQGGRVIPARKGLGWLYGMPGVASSHSVGLLIKRSCHDRFGMYSRSFPIAADQLFVKQALMKGATISHARFVAGEFSEAGTSGSDPLGQITELFRVQVRTERFTAMQYLLFGARLLKYFFQSIVSGNGGR